MELQGATSGLGPESGRFDSSHLDKMKRCGACEELKPLLDFNKKGGRYQSACRPCQRAQAKSRYAANSESERIRLRRSNKARRAQICSLVQDAKRRPCQDCKVTYPPCVMDFDHVTGSKKFNVSQHAGQSLRAVLAEMAKCEVVCANCHRLRTARRLRSPG